ncbi:hypothetical protein DFJ58DRAFT_737663 [Suillus subalutaceus]|uniref:uncharacterized protein n=1 Tax=Suillus subalutaceus TaxID=48586 RepID=UPI001B86C110|nr:uncharacterized protein DFJ58DRAFT_737663 [Suillus subalutaceus]KAG1828749.1 hypothetical protein DFJ58DRAFT_737663 [Suillus subalutaceus]
MTTYSSSSMELFSTNQLADETGLRAALCHLDALGGHSGLQPTIEYLLSLPHVFAHIVSVWDRSTEMISQLMADFPTDTQEYRSSLAVQDAGQSLPIKALLFPNVEESAKDVAPEVSFPEDAKSLTEQSAYLMVQPMKAALYFENANWAYKHLREHRRVDKKIFKIIYKKIKSIFRQISRTGQFSANNHKRLNGPDAGIPVFEAKMTKDLWLVVDIISQKLWAGDNLFLSQYQIDCVPDRDGESERQASFPPTEPKPETPASPLDLSAKDMEHLHSLLVLEKYVTFSQAFLHSLIANQDVHHVFMLSPQEQKVVESTTSCYVLGRSGTGLLESLAMAGYTLQEIAKLEAQSIEDDLIDLDTCS